jgi:hypothetical protein
VFVRDRIAGTTSLVSVIADGSAAGDRDSGTPVLNKDGSTVAFLSSPARSARCVENQQRFEHYPQ